jgi:hypothetical protein
MRKNDPVVGAVIARSDRPGNALIGALPKLSLGFLEAKIEERPALCVAGEVLTLPRRSPPSDLRLLAS